MTTRTAHCLNCRSPLKLTLVDLGLSPLANSYVDPNEADHPDPVYPLRAMVCEACLLVQLDTLVPREAIFNSDYAYFSSYSDTWLAHCSDYVEAMTSRLRLGPRSKVVEVASNDGYLLKYFVERGVPVLGVEPAANVARAAIAKGVATEIAFFGADTAQRLVERGEAADLIVANNVLAHVPDINDFVAGAAKLLQPAGVFSLEFPHLLNLIKGVQFDTIYHEHFTYLSVLAVERIFAAQGLRIFDAEATPTHGGSLRLLACHADAAIPQTSTVEAMLGREREAGLDRPSGYEGFEGMIRKVRADLLDFLHAARDSGALVAAYGAAAKGNTLLNYCGIGRSLVDFVADRSPAKQGRLLPGSRIPIRAPEAIARARPDRVLILPWNLRDEIESQLAYVRDWGGQFVTAIPGLRID
jgi:SAM-dependent methyltransferase